MSQLSALPSAQNLSQSKPTQRKRSACDRCHGQKLRCLKMPGAETCARCHKARATCIFSPANRPLRPDAKGAPTNVEVVEAEEPGNLNATSTDCDNVLNAFGSAPLVGTDWFTQPIFGNGNYDDLVMVDLDSSPSSETGGLNALPSWYSEASPGTSITSASSFDKELNFQGFMDNNVRPDLQLTHVVPATSTGNRPPTKTGTGRQVAKARAAASLTMTTYVRQLSELSVKLAELFTSIPPVPAHMDPPPETCGARDFSMEDLWTCTQKVIDIYPSFCTTFSQIEQSRTSPAEKRSSPSGPSSSTQGPDLASVHLLLSCHHRLTDTYNLLVEHTNYALASSSVPSEEAPISQACSVTVKIGTFEPSDSATIMIQFALICEFARQLHASARDTCSMLESTLRQSVTSMASTPYSFTEPSPEATNSPNYSNPYVESTISAWQNLRDRAQTAHTDIENLRSAVPLLFDKPRRW